MNSLVVNLYPKPNSQAGNMKMLSVSTTPSGGFAKLTDGGYTFHQDTKFVVLDVQDNDVYVTYMQVIHILGIYRQQKQLTLNQ
jgi:hypothetical protein